MFHAPGVKRLSNFYNNYELATDEFCYQYKRYRKNMSWKAFKKFGFIKGQVLCEKYDIILSGYITNAELAMAILDKFNLENLNKGIAKFNQFTNTMDKFLGPQPRLK